ncbi:MAG TPA: hypothetical protein DCW57_04625 [Planctomycetaceae bacterium]|nr:hypothetical protein [Planctomycetaceae bacterium]
MAMTTEHPHRRLNSLTGNWVLASPHRIQCDLTPEQAAVRQRNLLNAHYLRSECDQ